jgi:hypothetical protein
MRHPLIEKVGCIFEQICVVPAFALAFDIDDFGSLVLNIFFLLNFFGKFFNIYFTEFIINFVRILNDENDFDISKFL